MEYRIEFLYTWDLVKAGTRRFWLQFVGWGSVLRWVIISAILIVLSMISRSIVSYEITGVVMVIVPFIWIIGYFKSIRNVRQRFDKMENKQVYYHFNANGFGMKSELGSSEIPWRTLERVQWNPDVCLLFVSKKDYVYLPTAEVSDELKEFILRHMGDRPKQPRR